MTVNTGVFARWAGALLSHPPPDSAVLCCGSQSRCLEMIAAKARVRTAWRKAYAYRSVGSQRQRVPQSIHINGRDTWSSHRETFVLRCGVGLITRALGSRTDISRCRDVSRQLPLVLVGGSNLSPSHLCDSVCAPVLTQSFSNVLH